MLGSLFSRAPLARNGNAAALTRRRFQAYGIGSAKSGTNSISDLFRREYASGHEPEHHPMIDAILARSDGSMSDRHAEQFIAQRDQRLALEMDSSQLHAPFLDVIVRLFPEAKFIVTVRDCFSFLHSITDHTLARGVSPSWKRFREMRFGGYIHSRHERPLAGRGLYTLDGYLSYWAWHLETVLRETPADQLLVLRTHEIGSSIAAIAAFLGVNAATLDAERAHGNRALQRFGVIAELDPAFVEEKVRRHCTPLMTRFYSEMSLSARGHSCKKPLFRTGQYASDQGVFESGTWPHPSASIG